MGVLIHSRCIFAFYMLQVIDRVHFLVNNLTVTNVEVKAKELASLVPVSLHPWFANYLVVKRAAQEPNFHPVYVQIVERWGDRALLQSFVRTTIHYCKVMLSSALLKTNSSERTLLKNLGAWLGKLTLARNRPVLQRDLDIKATIIDAFEGGRMLPVLSFVRNLLEPCADSKAFRPPNPWVMAILGLLAEIYHLEGIRTSLKFEVELLFKHFSLQVQEVPPSALLAGLSRDSVDNMDFAPVRAAPGTPSAAGRPGEPSSPASEKPGSAAAGPVVDPSVMASLPNYIVINPQLAIVGERLGLKGMVGMAVERAVVEIISPVVDRSVTIACMTAHELVVKDFAVEPDPEAMRAAAHLSVAGLAQSLALVTAREPLRLAVTNNLRSLLAQRLEPATMEQVVGLLVNDNLDLCCSVIERAAGEKAQRELDERLGAAYSARARAKAAGQPFVQQLQGRFPAALPDALRARPGALTQQQQRVYQDFRTIPRTAAAAAQQTAGAARPVGAPGEEPSHQQSAGVIGEDPLAQLRARFISWVQRLDVAIARDPTASVTQLPDGHEAKALVAEVSLLPPSEAQALEIAKNVFFSKLFQSPTAGRMHASCYAAALAVLRDTALRRLPSDISVWLGGVPEEQRCAKESTEALLRVGLVMPQEVDASLAKSLNSARYQAAAELLLHLLQNCVIGNASAAAEPCLATTDFPISLDMLAKLAGRTTGGRGVLQLIDQARSASAARAGQLGGSAKPTHVIGPQDPPHVLPAVMKAFDQWARLLEETPTERVHASFVQELRDSGLLGGEEASERFLRVMTQLAVAHCLRSEIAAPPGAPRPGALSFIAIDAYVRLMVCLITQHGGGAALLSRVLGAVATHLQQVADERGGAFNGRPFFRIVIGLLSELSPSDPNDETGSAYLDAIAGFLYATRPLLAPAFAFPWLQLVADRRFMPRLLMPAHQRGWPPYLQLLLAQLRFLEPFLRHAELTDSVRLLYKGTLRLLLVLLHDFPEFLCQFHFRLCDAIPPSCIQMRNLVLSAFPRSMRLPDPFTQDLKVDTLSEVTQPPRYSPPADSLLPGPIRGQVEAILAGTAPSGATSALCQRLNLSPVEAAARGTRYDAPLINAIVFFVGIRAVDGSVPKPGSAPATSGTPAIDLLSSLLREMDSGK